jgi:hypothetical protein
MQLTVGGKVHAYVLATSDFVEATKMAAECTQQNLAAILSDLSVM